MSFSLTWLPQVLLDAGLKVAKVDGWEDRGRAEMGQVFGVICHHTAGPRSGNMPTLHTLIEGREDLSGPLAQLGLGRDGTYYVVAAGRCNHAGAGNWRGVTTGNSCFIGIEAENTGEGDDRPWPAIQIDAYHHGIAAILKHIGRDAEWCAGHKEYALPTGRKDDPDFDMAMFRASIRAIMAGTTPALTPIPPSESGSPGSPGRATLRRGDNGQLVRALQGKLNVAIDGDFGSKTEAAVRQFQLLNNLVPDGIVGPRTWSALDRA